MYKKHMKLAIEQARGHGSAFGAVLAMGDQVLVSAADTTDEDDPVGHAVMRAIRELGAMTHQQVFPGYALYSTVEPCPLCAAACVLTRLEAVYYGILREELTTPRYPSNTPTSMLFDSNNAPALEGGVLADECRTLL